MSGPLYPAHMTSHGPLRSLEVFLDELTAKLKRLPLNSPDRPRLITQIRTIEDELDARAPL